MPSTVNRSPHKYMPAKAKKPPSGIEGVTYVREWTGFKWQRRKPTLADLMRRHTACERARVASDAIRARARVWIVPVDGQKHGRGLAPVTRNRYRAELERAIRELEAKPAPRARKAKAASNGASPVVDAPSSSATPLETVKAAVIARAAAERATRAAVSRAHDAGVSMAAIAAELNMTRQGLYKYLARA